MISFRNSRWLALLLAGMMLMLTTLLVQAASPAQDAANGESIFKAKCAACHTVGGGKLVGPDLKGVTTRREAAWLSRWIKEPDKVLAEGDPIATQLLAENNNIPMPNVVLSDADVADLIAYIQSVDSDSAPASAPTEAAAPALTLQTDVAPTQAAESSNQPLSDTDLVLALSGGPAYGMQIFSGGVRLQNGGTNCIACHTVNGVGLLGGGALGPDLTHVYSRYGREGLSAALAGLPFPTMQGIFAGRPLSTSEQSDLLAFFAKVDQGGQPRTQQNFQLIFGAGGGLALILLAGMAFFYPRQRLSIAQRLRKNGKL